MSKLTFILDQEHKDITVFGYTVIEIIGKNLSRVRRVSDDDIDCDFVDYYEYELDCICNRKEFVVIDEGELLEEIASGIYVLVH